MENETILNTTLNATAGNATTPATTEGFLLAYSTLFVMAIVPIFIGSLQSVSALVKNKKSGELETMSSKDAAMFPLYASCALFGIYLIFRVISKEYINMLLTFYFFMLGILALTHVMSPVFHAIVPSKFPINKYNLRLTDLSAKEPDESEKSDEQSGDDDKSEAKDSEAEAKADKSMMFSLDFDNLDLINLGISAAFGVWYLTKKHWIANNIFGLAFSINAIELLHLNKIITGVILLGGLFIYDIFWVFGTNVMVTVAKSFEAPIKLVFPQDLLENGLAANKFAMLGLGDIVVPGIFIALLLRFDTSHRPQSRLYFYCGIIAYAVGLLTTIVVMHLFKHAQPALLYLVPSCLGLPIVVALVRGEVKHLFTYADSDTADTDASIKAD